MTVLSNDKFNVLLDIPLQTYIFNCFLQLKVIFSYVTQTKLTFPKNHILRWFIYPVKYNKLKVLDPSVRHCHFTSTLFISMIVMSSTTSAKNVLPLRAGISYWDVQAPSLTISLLASSFHSSHYHPLDPDTGIFFHQSVSTSNLMMSQLANILCIINLSLWHCLIQKSATCKTYQKEFWDENRGENSGECILSYIV